LAAEPSVRLIPCPDPRPAPPPAAGDTRAPAADTPLSPLLLAARQAAALCGVSVATWHRWAAAGRCPAPLRPSPGVVRWRAAELRQWTEAGCPPRREWEALWAAQQSGRPR
jgi:predicted DNA-binding transcriptional regulator AlpA